MSNLEIKNRIFVKVVKRLGELGLGSPDAPDLCPELTPDVIIIPGDQSLIFEAQTVRALEVLAQICGFALETMILFERIRVHYSRSQQIIDQLKAAGAIVSGEF